MRVLFINRILAHYRNDVLQILDNDPRLQCVFAAGSDNSGIQVVPSGALRQTRRLRNLRLGRTTWQVGVLRALVAERPSALVVEGDASILTNWLLVPLARLCGVRTHFWTIGWRERETGIKGSVRLAYYWLADELLVYGERGRELGIELGYPAHRITVVGNSISARASFESLEPGFDSYMKGVAENELPVVLAVARLTPLKRFDLLIEAAALAAERGRPFQVVLAGDGPERGRLVEQARRAGIVLHVLGAVYSTPALARLYEHASVTVLPKAAGLTTIQSLAHGVPVVTDDDEAAQVPESAAVVPGVTGGIYPCGDAAALENEVQFWIECMDDSRSEVRNACTTEVERSWTPKAHADRVASAILRSG